MLEAYFYSDPRIEEWVNQITEKIFTVCLLSGVDSEVEFQTGCEIVTKVAHLLQGISIFPPEYLEEGLKQLLEQQLPDSRVISNFPTFQDNMNNMLREGMNRALETQKSEALTTQTFAKENARKNTNEDTSTAINRWEVANELQMLELEELIATPKDSSSVIAPALVPSVPTKPYGIIRKTQVPEQADRLKHVLSNIFPNVSVCWNLSLRGQMFLAQVEDILICVHNPEQPCHVEDLKKEGWKVYLCSSNDLIYPRRLERGIRQIQRLGKHGKNE